ncbi:hypothetical protein VTK56DRAFT_1751 [Thermocarpiscus australiensis]
MPTRWVDWSKTTRSKDYRGSGSFATFLIIGPVCFFLGILFASFPYDFPLLWTSDPITPSYLDHLETHLRFMHQSPPLIARLLHIIVFVGFLGFFTKLFRPSEANVLFDGGSLILYVIGAGVYISNIVKGMRAVSQPGGLSGTTTATASGGGGGGAERPPGTVVHQGPISGEVVLGREDSLRVLSASHVILALVLVGVLVLQAGQWYAERKEADDYAKAEREAAERRAAAAAAGAGTGKKKL